MDFKVETLHLHRPSAA